MKGKNVRGRISVHPRGFGFLNIDGPDGETSAFIAPPDLNPFLDGDIVSATVVASGASRTAATELTLIERWRTELIGAVTSHGGRRYLGVDRLVANTDWPFAEGSPGDLPDGTLVVAAVAGNALVLVRVLDTETDVGLERCVIRHGLRSHFSTALIEAAQLAAQTDWRSTRRDLRDLVTVTIDAASTRDIDDALSVIPAGSDGAIRVLVSIADVDAFVPAGSALDDEARRRGTSVYLAGRVIPMLPEVLSSEATSLLEGVDRPALTAELRISPEGEVTSVDLYESVIRSHARLTYDAVAELFNEGASTEVPAAVIPTLRWLRTAAARISMVRIARGGVELGREEAYVSFDPTTREPWAITARSETEAHRLVERLMVAANEAVARWLFERGLPGVFRVHDEPTAERVQALAEFARNFGLETGFGRSLSPRGLAAFETQFRTTSVAPAIRAVLGKALGPARYTVHQGLHFGLAAPLYLHFTSPIRRYADLAVHRIVKRYLAGDRELASGDPAIESLAEHLNAAAYRASKAEAERHRMLVARLFSGRIGEQLAGNVVAVQPFGLIVQMRGTGATGTVAMDALPDGPYRIEPGRHAIKSESRRYAVGDAVNVQISGSNEELGRVEVTIVH